MPQSKHTYEINVSENIEVKEQLSTWKRWFNGAKYFFTVKVIPAKRK